MTPQNRAMARAVWRSPARAKVGARLRCFDRAKAVRPEWVSTTNRAAFEPPGDQAGRLDHALGDRLDPGGPRHLAALRLAGSLAQGARPV